MPVQEFFRREKIEYDKYGRMKYNPIFHPNNRTLWSTADLRYLIDWYEKVGPDEMSFALGRTVGTIMQKVNELRKQGLMPQTTNTRHKRIKNC